MGLTLRFYNDPVLRKRCLVVEKITPEIKQFIKDMITTMDESRGIGLAASQVGKLLQIFVAREAQEMPDGNIHFGEAKVYINSTLSNPSKEEELTLEEGCLSLPGFQVKVKRPVAIDISYMDIDGNAQKKRVTGYHARILMHEHDHTNGRLILDRTSKKELSRIQPQLRELKQKYKHTYAAHS